MNNEDRQALNAFLFTCHQMQGTGFGRLFSVSPSRSYRLQQNTPHSTKISQKFTHDEWQAFLVPFRKLVLNDEPSNLFRVINILSRNSNGKDQLRLRQMKRHLREAAISPGHGVQIATERDGKWIALNGKKILETYLNTIIFHNDAQAITAKSIVQDMHPFAILSMFHYVIFTYKQALRIAASVRLRYDV